MSAEARALDLKYALFRIVSDVVHERHQTSDEAVGAAGGEAPRGVAGHVRAQARALDDEALASLQVELGRGFLLELDRKLSRHQARTAQDMRKPPDPAG